MNIEINELINEYSNMVLQIAYQNTFNKSDAEDITQEVFIKLIKNLDNFKNKSRINNQQRRQQQNMLKIEENYRKRGIQNGGQGVKY